MQKKLSSPGMIELLVDGLATGPILVGELPLGKVFEEIKKCERQTVYNR